MQLPAISVIYLLIGLICLVRRDLTIKFAIIALPLTTIAIVNVYVTPVFAINLSQYGIMLLFVSMMLRKMVKKEDYVPVPRRLIILMSMFILFIPISWIAIRNPNLYTFAYSPLSGTFSPIPLKFSAQNISKAIYAIFGFFVFIVSFKALSLCNFKTIARTFVFSGVLMAFFGLLDFIFPSFMRAIGEILMPPNVSMGTSLGYGPVQGMWGVGRVHGLMWEAGGLAEYLLAATFFVLANISLNDIIFGKIKDKLVLLILVVTTMLTGSSSIIVAIFLFPFLLFITPFFQSKRRILHVWAKGIGTSAILILIILSLYIIYPTQIGYFYKWTLYKLRMVSEVGGGAREGGSLELLNNIFPQSPFIGLGLGSVGAECTIYGAGLVMMLANVGIVGTLLYLSAMIFPVTNLIKTLRTDDSGLCSIKVGFLWTYTIVAVIELAGRGLAILNAPHLWFLAGTCLAIAKQAENSLRTRTKMS